MKQPELGLKITELRKSKGLTQQELSDKCNINIRTLQRIELGKVDPRVYTIKQVLEAMECTYEDIFTGEGFLKSENSLPHKLKRFFFFNDNVHEMEIKNGIFWAWIMGIIYFIFGFPEGILGAKAIEASLSTGEEVVFILSKMVVLVTYIFFMRGFVIAGKEIKNQLLYTVSYLMIFVFPAFCIMEIIAMLSGYNILGVVIGESICMGILQVIFGYCLFQLEREFGRMAVVAGVLEIVAGITFITVIIGFIGLFLLIPVEILEIIILVKFYFRKSGLDLGHRVQEVLK